MKSILFYFRLISCNSLIFIGFNLLFLKIGLNYFSRGRRDGVYATKGKRAFISLRLFEKWLLYLRYGVKYGFLLFSISIGRWQNYIMYFYLNIISFLPDFRFDKFLMMFNNSIMNLVNYFLKFLYMIPPIVLSKNIFNLFLC